MNIPHKKLIILFKDELEFVYEKLIRFKSDAYDSYSLLNGKTGYLIFLAYYNKTFNDTRSFNKITELIAEIIVNLQNENLELNFCRGISGMVWALKHVNKLYSGKFFNDVTFYEIDNVIRVYIDKSLNVGDYDFLH